MIVLQGVALISKKDYDGAIKQFLLVCEQRPNSADNYVNVGVAYANKKDYVAALQVDFVLREHVPNLTGTGHAYGPAGQLSRGGRRPTT